MGIHQAVYALGMFAGPWIGGILSDALGIRAMFAIMAGYDRRDATCMNLPVPPIDLGPFVQAELDGQHLTETHVVGLCTPIELWDVPREGLTLRRLVGLKDRAEKARSGHRVK